MNKPCVFPFTMFGITYYGCIQVYKLHVTVLKKSVTSYVNIGIILSCLKTNLVNMQNSHLQHLVVHRGEDGDEVEQHHVVNQEVDAVKEGDNFRAGELGNVQFGFNFAPASEG